MAQFINLKRRFAITTDTTDPTEWIIPVHPWTAGSVQLVGGFNLTGSWTGTIKQSNDGATATAFASALSTTSVPYITAPIDLSGIGFLHVALVSGGGSGEVWAYFVGKSD